MFIPFRMRVKEVVWGFGGPSALVRKFDIIKKPITDKGIQKWSDRHLIPMDRWLQLVYLAKLEGRKLILSDYIMESEEEESLRFSKPQPFNI